ncbi:MAG: AAA family ATPase [Planctomycetes bacterium]|nr:AAA family ATPase [Planctomycetota bacterium]
MLEPSVKQKLLQRVQQLNAEGKLLSRAQLDQYYGTFRSRFGPDKLANLDGEALLNTMHAQNKDSLVYWLEFKNDEDFPAPRFGSIAGGSAFKFGIFRYKETETWVTGSPKNPKNLTVEEAIAVARKYRDQLLRGVEALRQLPPNGSDDDYKSLQARLDREAPDVSDLSWGHKYFHLLSPDKLDKLHNPELQRFHLLKMLQQPPDEGNGRYICAGRFVAAANELRISLDNLTEVLYSVGGSPHCYWRIGTSDGTAPRNHWPLMRDGNCVAVGWPALGNLSNFEKSKESRDKLQQLLAEKHPASPQAVGRARSQIFNFVLGIAESDVVLASDGGTVLGIGRVTGPYLYDENSDFPHRRPVQWLSLDEWRMPEPEGLQTTVHEVKKHVTNLLEAERRVQGAPPPPPVHPPAKPPTNGDGTRQQSPRLEGVPGRIQAVLERKGQLIMYGPPGTGKTFWAERAAFDLAAYWTFGKAFDQLAEDDKRVVAGNDQGNGLVRLCCFHPAYGYEDFIEGYRPETVDGQISFRLRDGAFKRLAKDAAQAPDRRFFLIVDEINRGDIPRIFGELVTVLEKDKRGKAIVLPVSGDVFRVPSNVYMIGTMNTADRSISLLDAALRRRFGFIELMPDATILKDQVVGSIPLGPWLVALNRRVCEHVGRDARNLQIGHSYLLQGERPLKDFAAFKRALHDDIIPLLEEYCYEDFSALQNILGNGLLDADKRHIRHELFEEGQDAELVQALLGPCPEILASPEALSSESQVEDVAVEEEGEEGADQ